MPEHVILLIQETTIFFLAAAVIGALVWIRRGAVAPLVALSGLVLLMRASGHLASFLGEGVAPPILQVIIDYVRGAPVALLIAYTCSIQARRYRMVRRNDRLRALFRRAPHAIGVTYLVALIGDLVVQPPVLDHGQSLPAVTFVLEFPRYSVAVAYAVVAAFVFVGAATWVTTGLLGLNQRLQNLFFGFSLVGLSALYAYSLVDRGIRTVYPEEMTTALTEHLDAIVFVSQLVTAGGLVLGILCYYAQGKRGRFLERYLDFLDLVGDLVEELANTSVSKEGIRLRYTILHQAAGEEFLDLPWADKRKLDNAFLAKVIWRQRTDHGVRRVGRERLSDLAEAYDDQLKDAVLAKGLREEASGERLPDTLQDLLQEKNDKKAPATTRQGLREAVSLASKTEATDWRPNTTSLAEWEQLVLVSLAAAGLLPVRLREAVLEGRGVSKKVLNAYRLAEYKIHNYRGEDTVWARDS